MTISCASRASVKLTRCEQANIWASPPRGLGSFLYLKNEI
jgi:hypothetical protein